MSGSASARVAAAAAAPGRVVDAASSARRAKPGRAASFTINGRFYGQPLTGVQRYGREIVGELDTRLAAAGRTARLALPSGSPAPPGFGAITPMRIGMGDGHFWEQLILLRRDASVLLNLCNTGPVLAQRQVVCIHDVNVIATPQSYRPAFRLAYRLLQPLLVRRAAALATVSHTSAIALAQAFAIPLTRIVVLPNGHEHARRWRASRATVGSALPERPFVLVIAGRARHKNSALLVGLVDALRELGLALVIAGESSPVCLDGRAGVSAGNVYWLGRVGDDDLALLFQRALCLAFPSRTEGFGLPIVEAMVHGCPVIASNRASMPEVCGGAALLADPDDPAAWLSHIQALRDSPALRDDLRDRGRRQACRFSWVESAAGYLDLMDGLA